MKHFPKHEAITEFDARHEPRYFANLGEEIRVDTDDCYGGQIDSEQVLRPDVDLSRMDLATGPISIQGLESGNILRIDILGIEVDEVGIMVTSPGLGPLGDQIQEPTTRLLPIRDGHIWFSEELSIPIQPMIGVVGVAPESGAVHCAVPGAHGGNLDTKDITTGHSIYLPVFHPGGLVAFGDLHAAMGDGELDGTGVETAGTVHVSFHQIQQTTISMPVVETETHFQFVASAKTFSEAIRMGMKEAIGHLQTIQELSFANAYRLLSATSDVRFSQIVNELVTVRIAVPKWLLAGFLAE